MPRHPRLQKRGSRYFLRVKVPADLRLTIGKREIRKALRTSDPKEALKAVRKASAETDAMFELMRGKVAASAVTTLFPASPVDLERAIQQEFHEMEILRQQRFVETDEHDREEILEILREDEAYLSRELREIIPHSVISRADNLLEKYGLYIDRNTRTYWKFVRQVHQAELEIVRRAIEAHRGNPEEVQI